ncbi:hypothetical protein CFLV_10600 [Corynebacterium flavescens]|uniref:Uncharacterized protein n=1 Tax=Corynebacterium flavescens TaxID=28028 RepID=A0A1L7CNX9_CORFL|nr:hypothetical protein CFLV_10600 [Corynebacterium flavescens]
MIRDLLLCATAGSERLRAKLAGDHGEQREDKARHLDRVEGFTIEHDPDDPDERGDKRGDNPQERGGCNGEILQIVEPHRVGNKRAHHPEPQIASEGGGIDVGGCAFDKQRGNKQHQPACRELPAGEGYRGDACGYSPPLCQHHSGRHGGGHGDSCCDPCGAKRCRGAEDNHRYAENAQHRPRRAPSGGFLS